MGSTSIINIKGSLDYYVTGTGITLLGRVKQYDTLARMLAEKNPGAYAVVTDASADPSVNEGGAIYKYLGGGANKLSSWKKIQEDESLDLDKYFDWQYIANRPTSTPEAIDIAVRNSHIHTNSSVLDKLSVTVGEDNLSYLRYDGRVIFDPTQTNANTAEITRISDLLQGIIDDDTSVAGLTVRIENLENSTAAISETVGSLSTHVPAHIANTEIHVTTADKNLWDTVTDKLVPADIASMLRYKGTQASVEDLEALNTGNVVGDVWHVPTASTMYVCTAVNTNTGIGTWTELGSVSTPDLSNYVTTSALAITLGDYVLSSNLNTTLANYVTSTDLNTTLNDYITSTVLNTTLSDYVLTSTLNTMLSNYVTTTALNAAISNFVTTTDLESYVTITSLSTTLSNYVTNTSLNTTLGNYVLTSTLTDYVTTTSLTTTLADYYTKLQTYNKSEVNDLIAGLQDTTENQTGTSRTLNVGEWAVLYGISTITLPLASAENANKTIKISALKSAIGSTIAGSIFNENDPSEPITQITTDAKQTMTFVCQSDDTSYWWYLVELTKEKSTLDVTTLMLVRPQVVNPIFLKIYLSSDGTTTNINNLTPIVDTTIEASRNRVKAYEISAGVGAWVSVPSTGLTVDFAGSPVNVDLSGIDGLPGYLFYRWETADGSDQPYESLYFPSISPMENIF